MLTSAPGALIKDTKKGNFCIGKSTFYKNLVIGAHFIRAQLVIVLLKGKC
jgi:hypothetical protein